MSDTIFESLTNASLRLNGLGLTPGNTCDTPTMRHASTEPRPVGLCPHKPFLGTAKSPDTSKGEARAPALKLPETEKTFTQTAILFDAAGRDA